jgi:Pentapeptide repeats (8 copies)
MKVLYWPLYRAFGWTILATTLTATRSLAANPQHVSQFETTGKCISCDLSGASFVGIDFSDVRVDLQKANLNGANFTGAIMSKANFSGASAVGSTFFATDLQGANLKNTNLLYANLVKAKLNNAILEQTDLQGANLAEADLRNAQVKKTDFVGANIYKMQYSPGITDAALGNYFKSDLVGIRGVLNTRSKPQEKIIDGRTLESDTRVRRRFRIPSWIGDPSATTATTRRKSVPADVGKPENTVPLGSRQTDPEELNLINNLQ